MRKIVSVVAYDASSFAMRISWLNFEPWSQSFLQSKPISGIDCLSYSGQHHCSFCIVSIGVRRIFHKIAKDASKPAVSWLKFEPKVSNFPAVSANLADTAHTTIGSLFLFNGYKLGYVWKWTSLIVVLGCT